MSELPAVAAFVGSVRTATEVAKLLMSSGSALEKAELKMKLAELLEALAEAKIQAVAIQEELAASQELARAFRERLEIAEKVVYRAPSYFLQNADELDGPFCQRCYDSERKLIRLQQPGREGYWVCQNCKNSVTDEDYEPPKPIGVGRRRNWATDY